VPSPPGSTNVDEAISAFSFEHSASAKCATSSRPRSLRIGPTDSAMRRGSYLGAANAWLSRATLARRKGHAPNDFGHRERQPRELAALLLRTARPTGAS
jgi:hypothetical protein